MFLGINIFLHPKEKGRNQTQKRLSASLSVTMRMLHIYYLYNLDTKFVIISCNVAFKEDIQHQGGAQLPENYTFINLQSLFLKKTRL